MILIADGPLGNPPEVTGCVFSDNFGNAFGGAIHILGSSVVISDCAFNTNSADSGGAIYSDSEVTILGCSFTGNTADFGGAVNSPVVQITDCMFTANSAIEGGAVNYLTSLTLSGSNFCGNVPDDVQSPSFSMVGTSGCKGGEPSCPADIDGDGIVGIIDFLKLLANWGPCP